ncbi:MAG: TAT-variant-translocated molybdopterin oxidoreductase [Acetobacteraceae bacterium]|nr:TAT-variant-translocated molybdopterin oxidoreductase [Acetobacteraceae bacterium]
MPSVRRQWRSIAELSRDPEFIARIAQEFPSLAAHPDRRGILKLMAAGLALAGLSGCGDSSPSGVLIPPVVPPPDAIPRAENLFATASVMDGYATGVLVRHDVGRPIKVEGNPNHPASLGATDAIMQAEILGFYDPDRATTISRNGTPETWQNLETALAAQRAQLAETHGEGFRILTGATTSPTLLRQLAKLQQRYPELRWHQWEPVSRDAVRAGAALAYGRPLEIVPKLEAADVILAIDSDLVSSAPGHVRFARDFASRRNPARDPNLSRVYAIEPAPTLTGVAADHRFIAGPADMPRVVQALADALLHGTQPEKEPDWVGAVVDDLRAHKGRAFVHAGPYQPPELHALVHAVNESLGGRGTTYDLIEPVAAGTNSLHELVTDMQARRVKLLVMIGVNPVFTAPGNLGFAEALKQVAFTLTMAIGPTETAQHTDWFVPQRHPYEDWSDARAFDGTATILQPQAQPLYGATSPHSLLALLLGPFLQDSRQLVQQTWPGDEWQSALAAGVVPNTASARSDAPLKPEAASQRMAATPGRPLTLLFRPDPHIWDGRFANNAWLQELPRPLTKLTWDNPLLISPEQARKLRVQNGDHVIVTAGSRSVPLPAWIVPGQAPDCIVATLGFGRTVAGTVGEGTGYNLFPLTGQGDPVTLRKARGGEKLACTEHHNPMDARGDFARSGTLAAFNQDPRFLADTEPNPSLYERKPPGPAEWGMSIDLNACIGCNACVVACMAENNIPVVGKEEVMREREMHWLRIDRYYEGEFDNPRMLFEPVLCMHCEEAPCEIVCPVAATVHDSEGLNVMVYNRCIGTRFCSNNCPYKVRRFNYFAFARQEHRPAVARNPEVTVRGRGVMEKCTFCLQRIAAARIVADIENRPVRGDEVRTACQNACPTQAFTFGNMADPKAQVLERKKSPLTYALLNDQNTKPRVTYEAKIVNPNPALGERA